MDKNSNIMLSTVALGLAAGSSTALLKYLVNRKNRLKKSKDVEEYINAAHPILSIDPDLNDTKEEERLRNIGIPELQQALNRQLTTDNVDKLNIDNSIDVEHEKVASWDAIKDMHYMILDKEAEDDVSDKSTVLGATKNFLSGSWGRFKDKKYSVADGAILLAVLGLSGYGGYKVTKKLLNKKALKDLDKEEASLRNLQDNFEYNLYAKSRGIPLKRNMFKTAEDKEDPRHWYKQLSDFLFLTRKGINKSIEKTNKNKDKSVSKGLASLYALYFATTVGATGYLASKYYKNSSPNKQKMDEVGDYFKSLSRVNNAPLADIRSSAIDKLDALRRLGTPTVKKEPTINSLALPPIGSNANLTLPSFKSRALRDVTRELDKEKEDTTLNTDILNTI